MSTIQFDESKIKIYSQIQRNLCDLYKNPSDSQFDNLIQQIPPQLLNEKEDLMVICELFALYGRIFPISNKKNAFKLMDKIMIFIKKILSDEPQFFWKIFGGSICYKLWFYQEGLITIEQVVRSAILDSPLVTEIFLPEIIEKVPEIFDKELKYKCQIPYGEEELKQYKQRRDMHMRWMKESCDYNDQIYAQIETDKLRLSIKRDDLSAFETILHDDDISVNSTINETPFENHYVMPFEFTLLDYSITCKAHKIIKYLINNQAELSEFTVFHAVESHDPEIIELIRSIATEEFYNKIVDLSINMWCDDIFESLTNNMYKYDYLEKLTKDQFTQLLAIMEKCFQTSNFMFFELIILPYLKKNPHFVNEHIYSLIFVSFKQMSCFFTKEFLKLKDIIDINHIYINDEGQKMTILSQTIDNENPKAIQIILSIPDIKINIPAYINYPIFFLACRKNIDVKSIDLICNYPGFEINTHDKKTNITAFDMAFDKGNFYTIEYILKKFPEVETFSLSTVIYKALQENHLYTVKITLKHFIEKDKSISVAKIINDIKNSFTDVDDIIKNLRNIVDELGYDISAEKSNDNNKKDSDENSSNEISDSDDDSDDDSDSDSDISLNDVAFLLRLLTAGS